MDQASDKQQGFRASTGIPRLSRLPVPRLDGRNQPSGSQSRLPRAHRPTTSSLARSNSPDKKPWQNLNTTSDSQVVARKQLEDIDIDIDIERPRTSDGNVEPPAVELADTSTKSTPTAKRRPRPSLSDRTIETLSRIPPSPSPARYKSGFYATESPIRSPSRPASSMSVSRNSLWQNSRPSSPTKQLNVPPVPSLPQNHSRSNRNVTSLTSGVTTNGTKFSNGGLGNSIPNPKSSSPTKGTSATLRARPERSVLGNSRLGGPAGSKNVNAKSAKPNPSLASAFAPPSPTEANNRLPLSGRLRVKNEIGTRGTRKASGQSDSTQGSTLPSQSNASSTASPKSPLSPPTSVESEAMPSFRKSSNASKALRETIAKAKAQALKGQRTSTQNRGFQDAFDSGMDEIPFNDVPKDRNKGLLRKRVQAGRTSGLLNIAGMDFPDIPDEVMSMYEFDPNAAGSSWAESVDMVKFIAADNRFGDLRGDAFPDNEAVDLDEGQNFQFRGLKTLDLHGNLLKALPLGLRRLDRLHALNLSSNKLDMSSLDTICQLPALRELYLSNNDLNGQLTSKIADLSTLHVLDLKDNSLTDLGNLSGLADLKILNVASNKLTSLPFNNLLTLPLIELTAYKNKFSGSLTLPNTTFPTLQTLDLSSNALTSLSFHASTSLSATEPFFLALQTLSLSSNWLTSLPSLPILCPNLASLHLAENALSALPPGFTSLSRLKTANLSANDIRVLDMGIAKMEALKGLDLSANPLRDRRLLGAAGDLEAIRRGLAKRMEVEIDGGMAEKKAVEGKENGGEGEVEAEAKSGSEARGTKEAAGGADGSSGVETGTVRKPRLRARKEDKTPGWLGGWEE